MVVEEEVVVFVFIPTPPDDAAPDGDDDGNDCDDGDDRRQYDCACDITRKRIKHSNPTVLSPSPCAAGPLSPRPFNAGPKGVSPAGVVWLLVRSLPLPLPLLLLLLMWLWLLSGVCKGLASLFSSLSKGLDDVDGSVVVVAGSVTMGGVTVGGIVDEASVVVGTTEGAIVSMSMEVTAGSILTVVPIGSCTGIGMGSAKKRRGKWKKSKSESKRG